MTQCDLVMCVLTVRAVTLHIDASHCVNLVACEGVQVGREDAPAQDQWARWLLRDRFGGNEVQRDRVLAYLEPIRETVLSGAQLAPGDAVLDVGCGDGLLGMAALDRVAPTGRVTFSDISADLLEQCRHLVDVAGAGDRAHLVETSLPELEGIGDAAVDAAVLRSVLIYVNDKALAFRHLHRVLRPGGRLSLFEPINSFGFPEPQGWLWGFDMSGLESLGELVKGAYAAHAQHDAGDPMLGFDERDLLEWAQQVGFHELTLTYEAQISSQHPAAGTDLATFLDSAPNPMVPTLRHVLREALTEEDKALVEQLFAEQLASGGGRNRQAVAYLTAQATDS